MDTVTGLGYTAIEAVKTGDSFEEIHQFEDETFARIIHGPPIFSLAGEIHRQLFRVLKPHGRLFH